MRLDRRSAVNSHVGYSTLLIHNSIVPRLVHAEPVAERVLKDRRIFGRKLRVSVPKREGLNIRSASAGDIPAMLALERDSATASHWRREQYDTVFREGSPRRLALVIEPEGVGGELGVRGFLVARAVRGEWEIENIVVAEASRRRGGGRRLLGEFISIVRANGLEPIFLEVRESNLAARSFYQDCGFVENGRRKGYYSDPQEDAVVYRLSIA